MARRPRFYVERALRAGATAQLSEEASHHAMRVLRLRGGDGVTLFDGSGGEYEGTISSVGRSAVTVAVERHVPVERESPLRVWLVQGISSGERMEFTIRKAVELGVDEIVPVLAAGSVARPKGERAAARQGHWQKIAISACEQCGRNAVPTVRPLAPLTSLRQWPADATKIVLSPRAASRFTEVVGFRCPKGTESDNQIANQTAAFVIAAGPEAGFNEDEEAFLVRSGFRPASLGPRVLRTETAGLAALAALSALRGDF
ncbi:MAG TPA: 16S rRNA (uracil(1498)-N(3))-methyltransferase [Burkholderiales bacterium]|nr:16S rRNA (uracil(1498)-N(3))-methyltransferase [Burkholderiales bacterium]